MVKLAVESLARSKVVGTSVLARIWIIQYISRSINASTLYLVQDASVSDQYSKRWLLFGENNSTLNDDAGWCSSPRCSATRNYISRAAACLKIFNHSRSVSYSTSLSCPLPLMRVLVSQAQWIAYNDLCVRKYYAGISSCRNSSQDVKSSPKSC